MVICGFWQWMTDIKILILHKGLQSEGREPLTHLKVNDIGFQWEWEMGLTQTGSFQKQGIVTGNGVGRDLNKVKGHRHGNE